MPTVSPTYVLKNECEPFTLFDMGVQCEIITQPSSQTSYDGSLGLIITGGTTPYTITWDNGQIGKVLTNIPAGTYGVTVVDYYGDYTARTFCELVAPTVTPTATPTMTPTPSATPTYPDICFIMKYGLTTYGPYQFVINGNQNGKPTWNYTSGSTVYNVIWNTGTTRWELQGWNMSGGTLVSTTTSSVPLNGWYEVGAANNPQITVTQGTCPTYVPLSVTYSTTNSSCSGGQCNGSIIITAGGGVSPYTYSINGGATFQTSSTFLNLCPQTYSVITKDSLGNTATTPITVGTSGTLVTYTINAYNISTQTISPSSKLATFGINISPPLPSGTTISFQLVVSATQYINLPGTGTTSNTTSLYKNNVLQIPSSSTSTSATGLPRQFCAPYTYDQYSQTQTYNLTITAGDVITGTTSSILTITNGQIGSNGCVTELEQDIIITTSSPTTNGCTCCNVVNDSVTQGGIINHILKYGQSGGGGSQASYTINAFGLPLTPGSPTLGGGYIAVNNAPVTINLIAYGGQTIGGNSQGFITIGGIGSFQTYIANQGVVEITPITINSNGNWYITSMNGVFNGSSGNYVTIQ